MIRYNVTGSTGDTEIGVTGGRWLDTLFIHTTQGTSDQEYCKLAGTGVLCAKMLCDRMITLTVLL